MNKIIINSIVVASLVASGSLLAFAQTKNYNSSKSNTAVTEVREAVKDAVTERKEAVKEAVGQKREAVEVLKMERETAVKAAQEKKQEAFESLKAERAAAGKVSKEAFEQARETMKNAQDEFKAKIEVGREAFKTKAEAAKEELKTKRETEKAELKIKLEKITLKQLTDFFYILESPQDLIRIKKLVISKMKENPEYLAAQIQAVTFQLMKAGGP